MPEEKARVRDIFTRLTRLDDDPATSVERRDTRQRVGLAELSPSPELHQSTRALVSRLADERLVVTSRDTATGREEVEVAHEALIRHWPHLREWLEEDRAMLRLREAVRRATQEWENYGRDDSYLTHRGKRLEEAATLLSDPRNVLNERERVYLNACREYERKQEHLSFSVEVAQFPDNILINVHRLGDDRGFTSPPSSAAVKVMVEIDLPGLRALKGDGVAYGRFLSEQFFADVSLRELFSTALAGMGSRPSLRWRIDTGTPALHDVAWETLCNPATGMPLTISGDADVMRLCESDGARLRPRRTLRALVAAVGAQNPDTMALAVGAAARLGRIKAEVTAPAESSLAAIMTRLRAGHDLLYIIAEAELMRGEPCLLLSDGSGEDFGSEDAPNSGDAAGRVSATPLNGKSLFFAVGACQVLFWLEPRSAGPGSLLLHFLVVEEINSVLPHVLPSVIVPHHLLKEAFCRRNVPPRAEHEFDSVPGGVDCSVKILPPRPGLHVRLAT